LKTELKKYGNVEQLKIQIIPPNPEDDFLDEIQIDGEEFLDRFKDANVTQSITTYTSRAKEGINLDSDLINDKVDEIEQIHSGLKTEDSIGKGYVNVEALYKDGRKFTTEENKPKKVNLRKKPSNLIDFAKVCMSRVSALFSQSR